MEVCPPYISPPRSWAISAASANINGPKTPQPANKEGCGRSTSGRVKPERRGRLSGLRGLNASRTARATSCPEIRRQDDEESSSRCVSSNQQLGRCEQSLFRQVEKGLPSGFLSLGLASSGVFPAIYSAWRRLRGLAGGRSRSRLLEAFGCIPSIRENLIRSEGFVR
jgi:hypothetical protein